MVSLIESQVIAILAKHLYAFLPASGEVHVC